MGVYRPLARCGRDDDVKGARQRPQNQHVPDTRARVRTTADRHSVTVSSRSARPHDARPGIILHLVEPSHSSDPGPEGFRPPLPQQPTSSCRQIPPGRSGRLAAVQAARLPGTPRAARSPISSHPLERGPRAVPAGRDRPREPWTPGSSKLASTGYVQRVMQGDETEVALPRYGVPAHPIRRRARADVPRPRRPAHRDPGRAQAFRAAMRLSTGYSADGIASCWRALGFCTRRRHYRARGNVEKVGAIPARTLGAVRAHGPIWADQGVSLRLFPAVRRRGVTRIGCTRRRHGVPGVGPGQHVDMPTSSPVPHPVPRTWPVRTRAAARSHPQNRRHAADCISCSCAPLGRPVAEAVCLTCRVAAATRPCRDAVGGPRSGRGSWRQGSSSGSSSGRQEPSIPPRRAASQPRLPNPLPVVVLEATLVALRHLTRPPAGISRRQCPVASHGDPGAATGQEPAAGVCSGIHCRRGLRRSSRSGWGCVRGPAR